MGGRESNMTITPNPPVTDPSRFRRPHFFLAFLIILWYSTCLNIRRTPRCPQSSPTYPQVLQNQHLHIYIKTKDFISFRMNTYTKTGVAVPPSLRVLSFPFRLRQRIPSRVTLA